MTAKSRREPNRRELTDVFIRGLPAPEKKIRWWDTKQGGLCLEVQPSGHKSFKVCYRSSGLLRWYHIDAYGAVYLKEARKVAREIRTRVALGEDPHLDKVKARQGITVRQLAEKYQEQYAKKRNKSWRQPANLLRWHVYPTLGTRKAKDVTRNDVRRLFRRLGEDRPIVANQVLAAISSVYSWALGDDEPDIEINPAMGIRRNPTNERERVLTDSELRAVWPAFDESSVGCEQAANANVVVANSAESTEV